MGPSVQVQRFDEDGFVLISSEGLVTSTTTLVSTVAFGSVTNY